MRDLLLRAVQLVVTLSKLTRAGGVRTAYPGPDLSCEIAGPEMEIGESLIPLLGFAKAVVRTLARDAKQ